MLDHASIMPWKCSVVAVTAVLLLCTNLIGFTQCRWELNRDAVEFWANSLGQQINSRCQNASGIKVIQEDYKKVNYKIKTIDGDGLVAEISQRIEQFLDLRLQAATQIKGAAEELFLAHTPENYTCDDFTYYNSKEIKLYKDRQQIQISYENSSYSNETLFLPMYDEWHKYYQVPVSLNGSAIHVPTNIYKCATPLLDNISWTSGLDDIFSDNYPNIKSSWQYFASSVGFLKYYPAAKWKYEGMDMFDARLTEWYTSAAALPKSVLILLDNSGSMSGLRTEIAKTTVRKIMESLNENDFFNLITFNNDTKFVDCDCPYSNGSLIQATARNIRRVSKGMEDLKTSQIANFTKVFELAFEVLLKANQSGLTGAEANNAIMVVTDGAPKEYKDIIKKYNWENITGEDGKSQLSIWTRVFSYLIGQEVTIANKQNVRWMGCANKGYFYHIGTMADVHDYVQDYVRVMARPLVAHDASYVRWTGVHLNMPLSNENNAFNTHARTTEWIRLPSSATKPTLTISVATPVYDKRKSEKKNGNLLGVAGVDINVDDILKLIPRHKLGALGYSFIINNNGFVISHPEMRPWMGPCIDNQLCEIVRENNSEYMGTKPRADYKNIDILHLEQEYQPSDQPLEDKLSILRDAMINGETGSIRATVKKFYNGRLYRVHLQTQTYFYAPIKNTPYSIAIVVVDKTSNKYVYQSLSHADRQSFSWCRTVVAKWDYSCPDIEGDPSLSSPERLIEKILKSDDSTSCDRHLAASVAFDVNITRGVVTSWENYNLQAMITPSESTSTCAPSDRTCLVRKMLAEARKTLTFKMVTLGTRSGVTRFQEFGGNGGLSHSYADPKASHVLHAFADSFTPSIDAEYYRKAAVNRKNIWAFSSTVQPSFQETLNTSYISVTASQGVYVKEGPYDLLASVFGLNIQYDSLFNMFNLTTSICTESMNCSNTFCYNSNVDCYLLDENGYVVVSEEPITVGKFFGDIDYRILLDMREKGMFEEVPVTDYQAVCTICAAPQESSSASSILNPFIYLFRIFVWHITQLALSFSQFSIMDLWHCIYYATAAESSFLGHNNSQAKEYVAREQPMVLYMSGTPVVKTSSSNLLSDCVSCKVYTNSSLESLGIDVNITSAFEDILVVEDAQNLTEICKTSKVCDRSYVAHRVPYTNLYLMVLEGFCTCEDQTEDYCIEESELNYGCTADIMNASRKAPSAHGQDLYKNNNEDVTEEKLTCGRSSSLYISSMLMTVIQVFLHEICR